ncbi:MAG TPA: ABC transporter ATP-binding protein [Acidimicrobiales bacterium]|nr:ABC transporter ATP-binding protein [Acidimicrobiales bacterium]
MIDVRELSVAYGAVQALRSVSFEARTGEITAVLGANGAGKTTLLRTISGLVPSQAGTVTMDGRALGGMKPEDIVRLGVGHVPEGRGVIAEFTVEENLRLGAMIAKGSLSDALAEQYERFPVLGERRKQHAATLSGGERQMLAMARAMIAAPSVLLLDEPSLGLAPMVTAQLMHVIHDLCALKDLTVILVEQNAKSALRIADRAVVLYLGTVVANDTAAAVGADEKLRQYYLGLVE